MGIPSAGSAASFGSARAALEAVQQGAATVAGAGDPTRSYLLVLRFAVINVAAAAALTVAWQVGWFDEMIRTDTYHIVKLIGLTFLIGLHQCTTRIFQLSHELNELNRGRPHPGTRAAEYLRSIHELGPEARGVLAGSLRLKLGTRLGHIRYIANLLVLLGLIGTVVGFIISLAGIDPSTVGEVNAIGPMVSTLLEGMAIALYTTLAGGILNIWLMINYRLLEHGTVHFYTRLVELGERR